MAQNTYKCRECGKTITANTGEKAPVCCGEPMELLEVCREAPSAEHYRFENKDEPCDDGSSGKRV